MKTITIAAFLAGWLATVASPLVRADAWVTAYPAAMQRAESACKAGQLQECESALQSAQSLVDARPDILCRLGEIQARLGRRALAARNLRICARSGLEFPPLRNPQFTAAQVNPAALGEIRSLHARSTRPVTDHEVRWSLADPDLIAEDIIADAHDGSFFVSSVHERKILRVAADGSSEDFLADPDALRWGVFALALDAARGILWATTMSAPQSQSYDAAEEGRSAVLRIDIRTRHVTAQLELPGRGRHGFGDMTLAPDGTVYVSDGFGGGVYLIRPEQPDTLQTVVEPGTFRSPQTPALAESRLLVPDYSRGIAIVTPGKAPSAVSWLQHPPELMLAGIDGLYLSGRTLVAVQNGTDPERVLIMQLDPGLTRVSSWRVGLAKAAGLGDPTHGLIQGERFLVLVNSGWDRISDSGEFDRSRPATPAQLWSIALPARH